MMLTGYIWCNPVCHLVTFWYYAGIMHVSFNAGLNIWRKFFQICYFLVTLRLFWSFKQIIQQWMPHLNNRENISADWSQIMSWPHTCIFKHTHSNGGSNWLTFVMQYYNYARSCDSIILINTNMWCAATRYRKPGDASATWWQFILPLSTTGIGYEKVKLVVYCIWDWHSDGLAFTGSVPLLRSLHWLPVKYTVHFKICLLTYKALQEEQPVYLRSLIATSLPPCPLRSNRGITLFVPRPSALAPLLFGTTFHYLSVQPPRLKTSQNIPFRLGLLMLRNSFDNFVFEHRSGCCATEPGYAGDIGAIEIWLIDWLIPVNCVATFGVKSSSTCGLIPGVFLISRWSLCEADLTAYNVHNTQTPLLITTVTCIQCPARPAPCCKCPKTCVWCMATTDVPIPPLYGSVHVPIHACIHALQIANEILYSTCMKIYTQ